MFKTRKVVIVGAGHVGSHVALSLIQSGEADDIVLIDILKEKAAAQALDLDDLQLQVKRAGDIEVDGKGCTEFGIANVACMLIKAIFHDEKLIWPCSTALNGEYGQKDVAAGVPCIIGKNGVEEILVCKLTEEEQAKFNASCDILRGFLDRAATL